MDDGQIMNESEITSPEEKTKIIEKAQKKALSKLKRLLRELGSKPDLPESLESFTNQTTYQIVKKRTHREVSDFINDPIMGNKDAVYSTYYYGEKVSRPISLKDILKPEEIELVEAIFRKFKLATYPALRGAIDPDNLESLRAYLNFHEHTGLSPEEAKQAETISDPRQAIFEVFIQTIGALAEEADTIKKINTIKAVYAVGDLCDIEKKALQDAIPDLDTAALDIRRDFQKALEGEVDIDKLTIEESKLRAAMVKNGFVAESIATSSHTAIADILEALKALEQNPLLEAGAALGSRATAEAQIQKHIQTLVNALEI